MRREDRRLSEEEAITFLRASSYGVLAMSQSDEPYAIPLNHYYEENTLYFHIATEGRKIGILEQNPLVTFVVSDFTGFKDTDTDLLCSLGAYFRSVICTGHARFITEPSVKASLVTRLTRHLVRDMEISAPDVSASQVSKIYILAVEIDNISGKACFPA